MNIRLKGISACCALIVACAARGQTVTPEAWRAAVDAMRQDAALIRFYSFKDASVTQQDLAGSDAAMRYRPDSGSTLTSMPGRIVGQSAALLDGDAFEAPALFFPESAFTVALWLHPLAMGSKTGNAGSVNGMIVASGSGFFDGWRLAIYDWNTRQPSIELGREGGAASLRAADGLNAGFWNHLAATWDGATLRLYVNGLLSAERPYAEPLTPPRSPLRVGFAGYGVGSLRMAFDEIALFGRALSDREIRALSLAGLPDAGAAERLLDEVAAARGSDVAAERMARYVLVYEHPSAPPHLRGLAANRLATICLQGGGAELPSRTLARLPEDVSLDADGQRMVGMALAASLAREGRIEQAVAVHRQMLQDASHALPIAVAETRNRLAEALRQAGRWPEAREQYEAIFGDPRLVASVRTLAALGVAQTWRLEGRLAEAEAAFRGVAALPGILPHLRDEAEACALECANLLAGRPARDPEATRARLEPLPRPAVEYVVSPKGDDANPGTLDRPFATLERARDALRAYQEAHGGLPPGGATVWLRGGRYTVTNTFSLTEKDSGQIGAPIVYRAWRAERPVLDGGARISGWRRVRDPAILERIPPVARRRVRVADLNGLLGPLPLPPQAGYGFGINNQRVRELFQDGAPLQIARWPNEGFARVETVVDVTNRVFAFRSDRLARWRQAPDLMASGHWYHLWAHASVGVEVVDEASGAMRLTERPGGYAVRPDRPFYVFNALEELDQPGEWFLDRTSGKVYLWPRRHLWFSEVALSRWHDPFIEVNQTRELVFEGLTLQYGQQHGLAMRGGVNAKVVGCVIRRLGGTALMALQSANLRIHGNIFHTLGHLGMHVSGGDRRTLTSGGVSIVNNEVRDFGRRGRTYSPALLLEGCGARVAHNWFHWGPSSAMRIEGNDHLIECNLVNRVVQESDDQGGIDMWGNPSYRGVVIRYNHWQDIGAGEAPCGQAGIRFDDGISGMVVYGNLFERTSTGNFGGVQIHGGQMNIIDNNLFVGCRYGVSFSAWSAERWEEYLTRDYIQRRLYHEVNIRAPPYSARYPDLALLSQRHNVNQVWRNVFVGTEQPLFRAPKQTDLWDNQTPASLPDLIALSARTMFRPLPLDEIGLYEDSRRARE